MCAAGKERSRQMMSNIFRPSSMPGWQRTGYSWRPTYWVAKVFLG